ncbi:acyltransferase [Paraburkholderia phenoliruptrix]|uniref:acyltransferase n=1 Tax=Paraburkholderia phenoliruptrix TaxID=252970 RepID=UPI0034CE406F
MDLSKMMNRSRLKGHLYSLVRPRTIQCAGRPVIDGYFPDFAGEGQVRLGNSCCFRSFRLRQHFTVLKDAVLEVGDDALFNDGIVLCAAKSIKIGNSVKIGDMVYIYDTHFHQVCPDEPLTEAPVSIGNNVWIGANSMVLAGASIGDHSVIAAGSIVTGAIPARSLAAGTPARVIRTFEVPDGWIRR